MAGPGWLRTAGPGWLVFTGWLVFSSIAGRLAQAGLCSVVLQDGWPRLAHVQ